MKFSTTPNNTVQQVSHHSILKLIPPSFSKNIIIPGLYICEKIKVGIFNNAPQGQNSSRGSCHHPLRQKEIIYCPRQHFFKNLFFSSVEREDYEGSVKSTIGSVIGSVNMFRCYKSEELPNSKLKLFAFVFGFAAKIY